MLDLIAFDADDTLWHNETFYTAAKERFKHILSRYQPVEVIAPYLDQVEIQNIQWYGYGIKSFALSMVETASVLSNGEVRGREIDEILAIVKDMLSMEVQLLEGVQETLAWLAEHFPLMLITKGDLFEQTRKIERSGLARYFRYIEVVADKTPAGYRALFAKYGLPPQRVLMVGNSKRSDIYPILALGGQAVYIPYESTWQHENTVEEAMGKSFLEIEHFAELPGVVERLTSADPD